MKAKAPSQDPEAVPDPGSEGDRHALPALEVHPPQPAQTALRVHQKRPCAPAAGTQRFEEADGVKEPDIVQSHFRIEQIRKARMVPRRQQVDDFAAGHECCEPP